MKENYNIKILNFRKLNVIPFNDDNPPADLKHISKFSTAWTVEIDSNVGPYVSKKLHVFQYINEECWLGDYVEESGHAVVTYEEPIELNDDNELVKTGDSYALFAYQPAEEWLGEKDEIINYSMWEDEDETEEDFKAIEDVFLKMGNSIKEMIVDQCRVDNSIIICPIDKSKSLYKG